MQIILNVDASKLRDTVEELMSTLTVEDKRRLAHEVFLDFLRNPPEYSQHEVYAKAKAAVQEIRGEWASEYEIMKAIVDMPKNPNMELREQLVLEAVKYVRNSLAGFVKDDPMAAEMYQAVMKEVREKFAGFVQEAVVKWFASGMESIGRAIVEMRRQ